MKRATAIILACLVPALAAAADIAGTADRTCFGPVALLDEDAFACPNGWLRGMALGEQRFDPTLCWRIAPDAFAGEQVQLRTPLGRSCSLSTLDVDWALGWPRR
jgi:hypothetical protein